MKNNQVITIINSILIISGISLIGSFWLFNGLEKYNHGFPFFIALVSSGIAVGFSIVFIIKHFRPNLIATKNKFGYGLTHAVILFSIILISYSGIILNELNPIIAETRTFKISHYEQDTYVRKGGHSTTYYAYVIDSSNIFEKVLVPAHFHEYYPNADSISISIYKGRLGFKYYRLLKKTD